MPTPETSLLALGDRNRLLLLRLVLEREASVGELSRASGLGQPLVSHHLAVLARHGWVSGHRDGRHRIYRPAVAGSPLVTVAHWVKRQVELPSRWRSPEAVEPRRVAAQRHGDLEDYLL